MQTIKMPAGAYYIGDPCLVTTGYPGYIWIEKLWALFYQIKTRAAFLEVDNVGLFIGQTYGGDGVYDGITVDTGTIAVINIDKLLKDERFNFGNLNMKGARFLTANEPFTIAYDEGLFRIGAYFTVNTVF